MRRTTQKDRLFYRFQSIHLRPSIFDHYYLYVSTLVDYAIVLHEIILKSELLADSVQVKEINHKDNQ